MFIDSWNVYGPGTKCQLLTKNVVKKCGVCSCITSRNLSAKDLANIKKFVDKDYNDKDPEYPSGICNGCHLLLVKKEKGEDVPLTTNQSYKSCSKFLQSCGQTCQCMIGKVARSNVHEQRASKWKCGRPKAADDTPQPGQSVKVCSYCFTELYPGCRHRCYKDRHRTQKLLSLLSCLCPKSLKVRRMMQCCRCWRRHWIPTREKPSCIPLTTCVLLIRTICTKMVTKEILPHFVTNSGCTSLQTKQKKMQKIMGILSTSRLWTTLLHLHLFWKSFLPPELHLMLCPVNQLYDELNNVWPRSEEWLKSCFIKRSEYHGGSFEGNECRKLLKNIESLKQLCPPKYTPFVDMFSSFNDVITSCYGSELHASYKRNIQTFQRNYLKLEISVTPKVHAVFFHVQEFCELTKMGLGPWSEQTSESHHHKFTKCWEKYITKDTEHPQYGKHLLQAVQLFNSLNI